jgi:hypothetical protein
LSTDSTRTRMAALEQLVLLVERASGRRPVGRAHRRGGDAALGCALHGAGHAGDMRPDPAIGGRADLDRRAQGPSRRLGSASAVATLRA